jgi:arginyl-tRNA synthetase
VFLEDVLDRAVDEARRIVLANAEEGKRSIRDPDAVAEQVGVGAVVFNDLKRERVKDVEFVWSEVLAFEGETGPYVQYTHARLASILRKAEESADPALRAQPDWRALEDAGPLLLRLGRFPEIVKGAAKRAEPSEVTQYLLALSRDLNTWYGTHRVLGQEPALGAARLALVHGCKQVLANGLRLLGVGAPEEM